MPDIQEGADMLSLPSIMSEQPSFQTTDIIELAARVAHLENCEASRRQREMEERAERHKFRELRDLRELRELRSFIESVAAFTMWCLNQLRFGPMSEAELALLERAKITRAARGVPPATLNEVPRPSSIARQAMLKTPLDYFLRDTCATKVEPFPRRDPPPVKPDDTDQDPAA